jgi:hypothetical protein
MANFLGKFTKPALFSWEILTSGNITMASMWKYLCIYRTFFHALDKTTHLILVNFPTKVKTSMTISNRVTYYHTLSLTNILTFIKIQYFTIIILTYYYTTNCNFVILVHSYTLQLISSYFHIILAKLHPLIPSCFHSCLTIS